MKSLDCPPNTDLPGLLLGRALALGCEWKKTLRRRSAILDRERVEGPHTISMDASARRYDVCLDGKDGINRAAGQALPAPSAKPSHPRFCAGASHKRSGVSQWQGKVLHASAKRSDAEEACRFARIALPILLSGTNARLASKRVMTRTAVERRPGKAKFLESQGDPTSPGSAGLASKFRLGLRLSTKSDRVRFCNLQRLPSARRIAGPCFRQSDPASARRQFPRSAGVPIPSQMPGPFWSRSPMASQTSRTGSLVRRFS